MKHFFPPINQSFRYLQTNLSDRLGSIWSSFNLDFITKRGTMRLSNKLVTNTTSSDDADLGLPVAFEFWLGYWWAICGTKIFVNTTPELTSAFVEDANYYSVGDATTQFDVTNVSGTTYRYTWDGTGTNPGITSLTFPVGASVKIEFTNMATGNEGTFTITGSSTNYFEVTNASGVAETDKTISASGFVSVSVGSLSAGYSTTQSDALYFNTSLWTTSSSQLRYLSSPTLMYWKTLATLDATSVHKLVFYKKYNRLYVVSGLSIYSVDTNNTISTSGDYTLAITGLSGFISTMVSNNSSIWIGMNSGIASPDTSSNQIKGVITQWDGFSNQITNEYKIESGGVLAMCVLGDIPYALDTSGRVLKYTGYSFEEIARLPFDGRILLNGTSYNLSRFVHYNGMTGTGENTIQILISNLNENAGSTINENLPSGIWELDLETRNFTHKYSPTLKARSSSTVTDFGQNRISAPGALKMNYLQSDSANGRSSLIAGFNYFTDATTVKSGIFIDSPKDPNTNTEGQKRGYFVTTWMEVQEITETFNRLWTTFKKFLNSTDKMIFKYRLNDEAPIEATITWTSTTTFTTTTDISGYVGYEAEIIQGTGSGACTNISTVTFATPTYTATIDTAISGVTGTAKARFQKWIKLGEISGQVLQYGQLPITQTDTRIQIKGILEWTGDNEFHKLCVVSTDDLKITP